MNQVSQDQKVGSKGGQKCRGKVVLAGAQEAFPHLDPLGIPTTQETSFHVWFLSALVQANIKNPGKARKFYEEILCFVGL